MNLPVELSFAWNQVPIMAEVLERAGSRDRKVIREAAMKLDIKNVMATRHVVGQAMAFDFTVPHRTEVSGRARYPVAEGKTRRCLSAKSCASEGGLEITQQRSGL